MSLILLLIGVLSPVKNDSSKCALPFIIFPSTDILSPAWLTTMSFIFTSSIVTSFSFPSTFIMALLGVICTNFSIASFVLSLLILSNIFLI